MQKSHTNSSKPSSAWARSSEKGYLGYYVAHQNQTGGYKDGLKGDDYAMNGPKKIDDERAKKIVDNLKGKSKGELEDRPENVRARAEKVRQGVARSAKRTSEVRMRRWTERITTSTKSLGCAGGLNE